ncbi:MAG: glycosyltransferase family 4 protein [Candidatus Mariimomonas ferrooxydans]
MKILLVNNFFYNRGGDCTYFFALKNLLEKKGHNVIVFSMHHPKNLASEYSKYFVSYINYEEEIRHKDILSGIKVLNRTIYSREAKKKIEKLIKKEKPDIAHLQNIHHHITPSIFYPLKKHNVPIIWTLHDYTIICPNTSFLSHGRVCEKCKKRKYFWPLFTRCKKDSFSASTMAALETIMHRVMRTNELVDIFIAPSEFLRKKIIEYGFKNEKLVHLNYFTDFDLHDESEATGDYYLYVGRISEEKGLKILIDAAVMVNSCKLKITGEGPILEQMVTYAKSKDKKKIIEFLGHKGHKELIELVNNCKFIVVPSEWYENQPYSVIEAFASRKAVIGSNIGGIPELIKDNETGLIFEPGNLDDLSSKIKYLIDNPDKAAEMGKNANAFVKKEFNGDKHYQKLVKIYEQAISKGRKK